MAPSSFVPDINEGTNQFKSKSFEVVLVIGLPRILSQTSFWYQSDISWYHLISKKTWSQILILDIWYQMISPDITWYQKNVHFWYQMISEWRLWQNPWQTNRAIAIGHSSSNSVRYTGISCFLLVEWKNSNFNL